MNRPFQIKVDDLSGSEIAELLTGHLRSLAEITPLKSRHALNLDELRRPDITFWSVYLGNELAGCGALRQLDPLHGELKSMRTAQAHLRKGVGSALVEHIISDGRRRGYQRLSLETGVTRHFAPAQRLYEKFGFEPCGPFGTYVHDPHSLFLTREI